MPGQFYDMLRLSRDLHCTAFSFLGFRTSRAVAVAFYQGLSIRAWLYEAVSVSRTSSAWQPHQASSLTTALTHALRSPLQGLAGVTLSAGVPALHGERAAVNQRAFFIAALYIIAIGTGALRAWPAPAPTCCHALFRTPLQHKPERTVCRLRLLYSSRSSTGRQSRCCRCVQIICEFFSSSYISLKYAGTGRACWSPAASAKVIMSPLCRQGPCVTRAGALQCRGHQAVREHVWR